MRDESPMSGIELSIVAAAVVALTAVMWFARD
jgi:hypothetical protein